MRPNGALRGLLCLAVVVLSGAPAAAQTCPVLPPLSSLTRGLADDRWTPAATQAPVVLLVVEPPPGKLKGFAPVHATLLPPGTLGPNGVPIDAFRIMMFGKAGDLVKAAWFTPTPLGQTPPAVVVVNNETVPHLTTSIYDDPDGNHWFNSDTLFCSGHSFTADGNLFIAGGTELYNVQNPDRTASLDLLWGLTYATSYSSFSLGPTGQWSQIEANFSPGAANMPRRWYSAVTRLADSRMLVTSGLDFVALNSSDQSGHHHLLDGTPNRSVEVWDSLTGWDEISSHTETPEEVWNPDYTHVFGLPRPEFGNAVLMFGAAGVPVYLQPDATPGNRWLPQTGMVRPGAVGEGLRNHGTSSTLLPLRVQDGEWRYGNGSVMQAGGGRGSDAGHNVDVYEFCAKQWAPSSLHMGVNRRHPATVLLPDGKVLIVSGHDDTLPASAQPDGVRRAQYLDLRPPGSFTTGMTPGGPLGEARGYHNVALLLADGRVFVAGGRSRSENAPPDAEDEKPTFRFLHPPYLSRPRPTITAAPTSIGYGQPFNVSYAGGPISEVVLIGLGSMTHAFDSNQRYVQLALTGTPGANGAGVIGPPDRQIAPPGHYMLFVLDGARTPSVARIVQLR